MSDRPEKSKDDQTSAAKLLGDWRAAGRDTIAARDAASVAAAAIATARAAEDAAVAAEEAAHGAMDAVNRAKEAAALARKAADQASQAAVMLTASSEGDQARANQAVTVAEKAEAEAATRFHAAEGKGFPKEPK